MVDKDKESDAKIDAMVDTTINHYQNSSDSFWHGTKDHDVTQNYQALLTALPSNQKLTLLDFGCGPGRDLKYFQSLGHEAVGLDGSSNFCEMAREYTGAEVLCQDFRSLDLPANRFGGVFANASLFHVPKSHLNKVLQQINDTLKTKGVLFTSSPRGMGENFDGSRYGNYHEFESFEAELNKAGFEVLHHYYRPKDLPRNQQPWLAVVSRKI